MNTKPAFTITVNDLPAEILGYIFSKLDPKSLVNASAVNNQWKKSCQLYNVLRRSIRKQEMKRKKMRWNRKVNGDARFNFKAGQATSHEFIDKQLRLHCLKIKMTLEAFRKISDEIELNDTPDLQKLILQAKCYKNFFDICNLGSPTNRRWLSFIF